MSKRKAKAAAGLRYKRLKENQQKKIIVQVHKAMANVDKRTALVKNLKKSPYWDAFDPWAAGMEEKTFSWVDDIEDRTCRLYPTDLMISLLMPVNRTFAVFMCIMRIISPTGEAPRSSLYKEVRKFFPDTTTRNVTYLITKALSELASADLLSYNKGRIFVNPTFAYRGDRASLVRTLRGLLSS